MARKPTPPASPLGELLQRIREQRAGAASRAAFGRELGVSRQHIAALEAGEKRISETLAQRIAERFGTSEEDKRRLLRELLAANAITDDATRAIRLPEIHEFLFRDTPPAPLMEHLVECVRTKRLSVDALATLWNVDRLVVAHLFETKSFRPTPKAIELLANHLGEPVDTWLARAGFSPAPVTIVLDRRTIRALVAILESLGLEPADLEAPETHGLVECLSSASSVHTCTVSPAGLRHIFEVLAEQVRKEPGASSYASSPVTSLSPAEDLARRHPDLVDALHSCFQSAITSRTEQHLVSLLNHVIELFCSTVHNPDALRKTDVRNKDP